MVYILTRQPDLHPEIVVKSVPHSDADWKYRLKGLTVPAHLIPQTLKVESPSAMPDIYEWIRSNFIISSRARVLFETLAPDAIEYIPIKLDAPAHMALAPSYYYMNPLVRRQLVDWSKTTLDREEWRRTPAGKPIIYAPLPSRPGHVEFLPTPKYLIWHELTLETSDAIYNYYPENHLLTDDLWTALNARFPNTIEPNRIG
jgi:hypothetical protein